MRLPWQRRAAASEPHRPGEQVGDPRIWGRRYYGPHPAWWGALVAAIIAAGVYLAFAKQLPWSSPGYTLSATFENAATLRETAPVRIAGVNVGKVTDVEAAGDAAKVTFTVEDQGRPIHSDAEIEIRPRLFLEGNFFLDLRPGSPSAPELEDGGAIPITQTATAVQLDEVLTALQAPQRRGLQRLLEGFGTALTYEPTPADDATQDVIVQGETAAESLNDAFQYGGPAGRNTAIVADALRGEEPRDLARMIRATGVVFQKLASREADLQDLVTNLNVTAGAFASESENLSRSVELLAPTLSEGEDSLEALKDALDPVRRLAFYSRPGIQELPATIAAFEPWLTQTRLLLRSAELGGTARLLKSAAPGLAQTAAGSKHLLPQMRLAALCTSNNLVPAADTVITTDAAGFNTGEPNFQELFYGAVQLAGGGSPLDGNGPYLRIQPGGGPQLVQGNNPGGSVQDTLNFSYASEVPDGIQPVLPDAVPPFRMDVACHQNDVPNLNGPAAAAGPSDLVGIP